MTTTGDWKEKRNYLASWSHAQGLRLSLLRPVWSVGTRKVRRGQNDSWLQTFLHLDTAHTVDWSTVYNVSGTGLIGCLPSRATPAPHLMRLCVHAIPSTGTGLRVRMGLLVAIVPGTWRQSGCSIRRCNSNPSGETRAVHQNGMMTCRRSQTT